MSSYILSYLGRGCNFSHTLTPVYGKYSVSIVHAYCYLQERYQKNVTAEFEHAIWVTTSAIFPIGGIFGSLFIGPLLSRFGRRVGLLLIV